MTERTWQRGPFPDKLEWNQPPSDGQSYITHSEEWAKRWADMGCEVHEITNTEQPCTTDNFLTAQ